MLNEKKLLEEKKYFQKNIKLIKKFKIKENIGCDEMITEGNNLNNYKFPLIKPPIKKEEKIESDNINKNKVYISALFPMKKYKLKKEIKDDN